MGTKNNIINSQEGKNEWISILLILTTVLFGVAAQIVEKLNPIDPDTHEINSGNYAVWLALEIATITLFSSVLYLIVSYKSNNKVRASIYSDIALTQMTTTNGILISIILYYLSQHLAQNNNMSNIDKKIFIIFVFLVFIVLPTYVYMENIKRTVELWTIMLGSYVDQRTEEAPLITAIFLITFLLLGIMTIGTVNTSQAFGVLILSIIIIVLPYIGVSTKEKLELESKLPSRALTYILTSYSVYFIPVFASGIIEFSIKTTKETIKIDIIIIGISTILWILSVIELSLKGLNRLKKLKTITAIAIVIESIILSGMLYFNIYISLVSSLFFIYIMIVTISIGPLTIAYVIDELRLKRRTKKKRISN